MNGTKIEDINGDMNGHNVKGDAAHDTIGKGEIPFAICGLALRLPGGLRTPQQFWEFLLAGGDARTRVPESRYNISAFYDPDGKPASVPTEYGYFLDDDLRALDTSFFSMPRSEAERASPEQRLMLEVARECLEDAGETDWRGRSIGCYMGNFGEDWCEMFARESQGWGQYRATGYGDFVLSNRISYELGLRGPSITIRTACSSSLIALNEACVAVARGDCHSALVGGSNLILTPGLTSTLTDHGVLAKDGSCKTFSADADGYARGEAIAAIYVKRLSDAIRDGSPIRAVIRGTAINSDGKTPGMGCPSADAHELLIKRAYAVAGVCDYSQTGFVECHGTGTPIGDPIEAEAVARVFGKKGVYIGSVKPNIGHTEGASGLASIIKVVLSLENRTIPPNIKMGRPNPAIPFESARLIVPLKPTPWPHDRLERASINSFGIGGANAHVVIDSAASFNVPASNEAASVVHHILLFSANSQQPLTKVVENYREYVEQNPEKVADVAYTLANRREHLPHRAFAIAKGGVVGMSPPTTKPGPPPSIVMVFTGQGAQWPLMGRELMQSNPAFLATIRSLDRHLQGMKSPPQWKIEGELHKSAKKSRIHEAEISQPLCTAVQIALVDAFAALGVHPHAVVGHSSGEIAAAYASQALTSEEAIIVAYYRGLVTTRSSRLGAMAAVGMSWADTQKHLIPGVAIACDNSPKSVTISGDADKVDVVISQIREAQPGILARKLQVNKAYHSHHMMELGDEYHALLSNMTAERQPNVPFFSSVTGRLLSNGGINSRYWQKNLESPVLFQTAVSSVLSHSAEKNPLFLEIGPHSALAAPLRQILSYASRTAPYVPTMVRNQNSLEMFLTATGHLYTHHVPISFKSLAPAGTCLPDLPRYPWNHTESFWCESRLSREYRLRQHPHHDLLGVRVPESSNFEPAWRNLLHLNSVRWLRDHRVGDEVILPMAAYLAMAGEAVRQASRFDDAYRLRRVVVSAALIVPEGQPTELLTTLRRHRLTDSLDSAWWEFSIASHNGSAWKKHCTGLVTAQPGLLGEGAVMSPPPALPRKISTWTMFDAGTFGALRLGPTFRNMKDISGDTRTRRTVATLLNGRHADAHKYHLHPGVIDNIFSVMAMTQIQGYTRTHQTCLPVSIEDFSATRCLSNFTVDTWMRTENGAIPIGEARGVVNGIVITSLTGMKEAVDYDLNMIEDADAHAAARQEWGADVSFMDLKKLIGQTHDRNPDRSLYSSSLDELSQLCLLSSKRTLAGLMMERPHLQRFQQWIDDQLTSLNLPGLDQNDEIVSLRIEELVRNHVGTPAEPVALGLQAVCYSITSLCISDISSWESLLPRKIVAELYDYLHSFDVAQLLRDLAHSKPNLRVLELDPGSGNPSLHILGNLTRPDGSKLCSKYVFASKGFVPAQEREVGFPNLEYASLDIGNDPLQQGFGEQQFDLVIARFLISGMDDLGSSLANIRTLLRPSGFLLQQELFSASRWVNFIFGTHPRWWSGPADSRGHRPNVSVSRRRDELVAAGFEGSDAAVLEADEPSRLVRTTVVRPSNPPPLPGRVGLLCGTKIGEPGLLQQELEGRGYEVLRFALDDPIPSGVDIIALLDRPDRPFLDALNSNVFEAFQRFVGNLKDAGVFWVTGVCQSGSVPDPRFAQVLGLARVLRAELLLDFATCEVDEDLVSPSSGAAATGTAAASAVARVFEKFCGRKQSKEREELLVPDLEYAVREGVVEVGRIVPFSLSGELRVSEPGDGAVLDIAVPGRLATLSWVSKPAPSDPGPEEVEIEVYAAGLNFRDVLVGLKVVDLPPRILGFEGAGVVRRVGLRVNHVKVGDRVAALAPNMFATTVTVSAVGVVRIPDDLSFVEASVMFLPYFTAMYSLVTVGNLEQGQSVLIHSACGGAGLAALHLAQMIGAEVYVTVGTEEKVQFLVQEHGIKRNRIFTSRDISFAEGIKRETQGRGVDLVLNSVSGELLHATWHCIAPFGKLVELGKRDLIGYGKLDMDIFLANRSYCCVDVAPLVIDSHKIVSRHMSSILDLIQQRKISPLRPIKVFDAASPYEAFRYMQPGQHIGRICISLRQSADEPFKVKVLNRPRTLHLNAEASYLLVGGLGGLGRSISTWMVENGARNLMFLSRSAGLRPEDEFLAGELNSMDCTVQLIRGDVTNLEDVQRAINAAAKPLKGIVQMSMVLHDENFSKMTFAGWAAAASPKVRGTRNLHEASLGLDLDFFVLFSSLSGTIGQPGQANYAGGNTFLDAFAAHRRRVLGLPASAVAIGAVAGVGYLAHRPGLLRKMGGAGFQAVHEQHLLDALTLAMGPNPPEGFALGLGSDVPLDSPACRAVWRRDRRMAIYHNAAAGGARATGASATANSGLKAFLDGARMVDSAVLKTPEAASFVAGEIGKKLFELLLKPEEDLNVTLSLVDLGMDSLVGTELRAWWRQVFGFDVTVLEMLGMASLDALGKFAADGLLREIAERSNA